MRVGSFRKWFRGSGNPSCIASLVPISLDCAGELASGVGRLTRIMDNSQHKVICSQLR